MNVLLIHNFYRTDTIGGEDLVFRSEVSGMQSVLGDRNVFTYSASNNDLSKLKLIFSIWFSVRHFFSVYRLVKKNQIDVVHVHNFFPMLTPSVFLAARLAGAKTVATLHNYRASCISGILYRAEVGPCELCVGKVFPTSGIRYSCYRNSTIQSLLAQAAFSFYRIFSFFSWVDRYFVLSPFQMKKMIELGESKKKLFLKPNFVEASNPQATQKRGFVYVGRIEEAKGVLRLLEVWLTLDASLELTLIGSGEMYDELKERFPQKNIRFTGALPRSEVLKRVLNAQYLLQTSLLYETFGLTMIEAMSVGTPVIGFNIGTRTDLIENAVNGFVCDPEDLSETVQKAASFSDYDHLVKGAKATADRFNRSDLLQLQVDQYRALLNRS
jgi:glycosyltransferase involved in cell wall biosynthesis